MDKQEIYTTESPVHIQLSTSINLENELTTSNVLNFHQQQLFSNKGNKDYTMELVEILGGIDQILTDYLSSKMICY